MPRRGTCRAQSCKQANETGNYCARGALGALPRERNAWRANCKTGIVPVQRLLLFVGAALLGGACLAAPARPAAHVDNAKVADAARRIVETHDAAGVAFLVIDKERAELFVFAGDGSLRGRTPVLLGSARGDHTGPGIGDRPLSQVLPHERTTPAGRFVGEIGRNARGESVVWVDYDAAVSIHRVLTTNRAERRLERLRSPTPADNRISYGCINVLPGFFERLVLPAFTGRRALIYILPEETAGAFPGG